MYYRLHTEQNNVYRTRRFTRLHRLRHPSRPAVLRKSTTGTAQPNPYVIGDRDDSYHNQKRGKGQRRGKAYMLETKCTDDPGRKSGRFFRFQAISF
jgi:hypothetical protein